MVLLSACNKDNADTDTNPNANQHTSEQGLPANVNPNTNQSNNELLAGMVQSIDGMKFTIDSSQVFVANEPGAIHSSGEPLESQDITIRVTEETSIEVETTHGGQVTGARAGTIDDLSLQAIVIINGEWQGDEFVATNLTIFN